MTVARERRASLRAELARVALRWFVRSRSHHRTIEQERRSYGAMQVLIPHPPRHTKTTPVDAGSVAADWVVTASSRANRLVLFLHGGGYRVGSPATYRHFTWRLAAAAQARLLAIDYRLAPEHPFPAALDDAVASYRWLLERSDPRRIAVIGDSAGGGLALAMLLKLRDDGLPLPAAAVALSPWTDLALTGASYVENARLDPMLNADDIPRFAADYLAGTDARHPYVSPLYGDPAGLPPTLLHVGSDEILRDDAVRMAENMRRADGRVELEVWPRMPHVWHAMVPVIPEAGIAIERIGAFLREWM